MLFKDKVSLGVIVCRLQVPYLTNSHMNMIRTVIDRHNKILILLGVTSNGKINQKNPLDFVFRKQMVENTGLLRPVDTIMPIQDNSSDEDWANNLDHLIIANLSPDESAIIYGGRDSFIPFYTKHSAFFQTKELDPIENDSGTELRAIASSKIPIYSKEVAEAIIYTVNKLDKI